MQVSECHTPEQTRRQISITYSRVTPESAEQGDAADHGFYQPGGWEFSTCSEEFEARAQEIGRQAALAEQRPEPEEFDTISEAIDFLASVGPLEPSTSPARPGESWWLCQIDAEEDYETGESRTLSFHLDGFSVEDRGLILQRLGGNWQRMFSLREGWRRWAAEQPLEECQGPDERAGWHLAETRLGALKAMAELAPRAAVKVDYEKLAIALLVSDLPPLADLDDEDDEDDED